MKSNKLNSFKSSLVSHHLLLCATPQKAECCLPTVGKASWLRLKELIKELHLDSPNRPEGIILRTKVDCLRICTNGPVLLVWPEGIWYGGVTPERVEIIVREHLISGRLLNDWIIKRTSFSVKLD